MTDPMDPYELDPSLVWAPPPMPVPSLTLRFLRLHASRSRNFRG
jgi:hypothetical protein